jgi:hypothetical protein
MSNRPTLKKSISRNSILLNKKPSKQLIVENAVFPEQQTLPSITVCNLNLFFLSHHHHLSFLLSFSQVNLQSQSKEKKKTNITNNFINPTDIFAQNLSDAVMDAEGRIVCFMNPTDSLLNRF